MAHLAPLAQALTLCAMFPVILFALFQIIYPVYDWFAQRSEAKFQAERAAQLDAIRATYARNYPL